MAPASAPRCFSRAVICVAPGVTIPKVKARSPKCCPYLTTLVSGSPIIQDGKLVGAVTHVMIGDPTAGYGIFIENMLSAAEMPKAKAA